MSMEMESVGEVMQIMVSVMSMVSMVSMVAMMSVVAMVVSVSNGNDMVVSFGHLVLVFRRVDVSRWSMAAESDGEPFMVLFLKNFPESDIGRHASVHDCLQG